MTQAQFYTALGFGIAFFSFLGFAFFRLTRLDPAKFLILRIMTALFGAITAGLFTGAATVKVEQTIPGGHLTISGVAGFAFFVLVWLTFPKLVSPDPTDVYLEIPEGWSFQQALCAIAQERGYSVDFGEVLTKSQLSKPLRSGKIQGKTPEIALKQVRTLTKQPGAIPKYEVMDEDSVYTLKVSAS